MTPLTDGRWRVKDLRGGVTQRDSVTARHPPILKYAKGACLQPDSRTHETSHQCLGECGRARVGWVGQNLSSLSQMRCAARSDLARGSRPTLWTLPNHPYKSSMAFPQLQREVYVIMLQA